MYVVLVNPLIYRRKSTNSEGHQVLGIGEYEKEEERRRVAFLSLPSKACLYGEVRNII